LRSISETSYFGCGPDEGIAFLPAAVTVLGLDFEKSGLMKDCRRNWMIKSWEWRRMLWDGDESMCVESKREEGVVHGSCDEANASRERRIWSGNGEEG